MAPKRVQNYVGAWTTGTHGTGRDLGNLAAQVIGFCVLDSSGNLTVVNATHDAELLPAFRVSLGALGIITQVTVQAEPVKYLKRTTRVFKTTPNNPSGMCQYIHILYGQHEHVPIWGPHIMWNRPRRTGLDHGAGRQYNVVGRD